MSFITKDQFTVGIVLFFGRIYIAFVYFQRNDMDTDAIYTMVSLVVIIIISLLLNYFLVIKIFCFDSNSREWYGFAIGSAFSGVIAGFYPILATVFGAVWLSNFYCNNDCSQDLELQQMASVSQGTVLPTAKEIDVQLCTKKEYRSFFSCGDGVCSAVCPRGVLKLK
jgi:hypothetical protein